MSEGRLPEADQELAKIPLDAFDDFIVNSRMNQFLYERKFKRRLILCAAVSGASGR